VTHPRNERRQRALGPWRVELAASKTSDGRRLAPKPRGLAASYVFLHGFDKKDKANVKQDEKKALQFAGKVFLNLSPADLTKALQAGVLVEVHCVQQAH